MKKKFYFYKFFIYFIPINEIEHKTVYIYIIICKCKKCKKAFSYETHYKLNKNIKQETI